MYALFITRACTHAQQLKNHANFLMILSSSPNSKREGVLLYVFTRDTHIHTTICTGPWHIFNKNGGKPFRGLCIQNYTYICAHKPTCANALWQVFNKNGAKPLQNEFKKDPYFVSGAHTTDSEWWHTNRHTHTHIYLYVCIYVCVCVYIYIYIYIERERERKKWEAEGDSLR